MSRSWVALAAVAVAGCLGEPPDEQAGARQGEMVLAELVVDGGLTVFDEPLPRNDRRLELARMQVSFATRAIPPGALFETARLQLIAQHGDGTDFWYAGHLVGLMPRSALDRDGTSEIFAQVPVDPRPDRVFSTGCAFYALDGGLEIDSTLPGCNPQTLASTSMRIRALPPPDLHPDYRKLQADGEISAAVIVGLDPASHAAVSRWLRDNRFAPEQQALGRRWTRTVGWLREIVDVYSPDDAAYVTHEALLANARATHEIVLFHGHGFSTNAPALEAPVPNALTYQVIFMDTCWSDQQYGWAVEQGVRAASLLPRVDFVWSIGDATTDNIAQLTQIVLGRLLEGAELHPGPGTPGWAAIVGAVNERVEKNAREHRWPSWTHFGVTRYER